MIKTGIASVALAASAIIIAAPASAEKPRAQRQIHVNDWGQTHHQVRALKDQAIEACLCQLQYDAAAYGFQDAFIADQAITQLGPRRFRIRTRAKVFNGRSYDRGAYTCTIRQGEVIRSTDLKDIVYRQPQPRRHNSNRNRRASGFTVSFNQRSW